MIARAFVAAGVDYVQWKAISRTLLRSDFRPPAHYRSETYSLRSIGSIVAMVLIYGLMGLSAALVVVLNRDPLLTTLVMLSYAAMVVVTALLTQHGSALVSTSDYAILGPLPISSRTFLAVRITNVLFHTVLLTTLIGYPPILAQMFARGTNVGRGLAAALALYGFCVAVTGAVAAAYATVLRAVGTARLERMLGYAQTGIGLFSYLGIVVVMQVAQQSVFANLTIPRGPWLFAFPPAWFASYVELAVGEGDVAVWFRAVLSVVCLASMLVLLRGPLAAHYAEQIGQLSVTSSTKRAGESAAQEWSWLRLPFFRRDESRAVALLVRAQFRHDLKVRLGILSIIPMTLVYMYLGAREGSLDPFQTGNARGAIDLTAMIVLFFPSILLQQLAWSDAYKAAWVYFATPADRARLIIATRNVIVTFFILPFMLFLGVVYTWRFAHAGHAVVHAGFLGLLGQIVLQAAMITSPRLPFATTQKKASGNVAFFATMMVTLISGNVFLVFLQRWVYQDSTRTMITAVLLAAAVAILDPVLRARARASLRNHLPELG